MQTTHAMFILFWYAFVLFMEPNDVTALDCIALIPNYQINCKLCTALFIIAINLYSKFECIICNSEKINGPGHLTKGHDSISYKVR